MKLIFQSSAFERLEYIQNELNSLWYIFILTFVEFYFKHFFHVCVNLEPCQNLVCAFYIIRTNHFPNNFQCNDLNRRIGMIDTINQKIQKVIFDEVEQKYLRRAKFGKTLNQSQVRYIKYFLFKKEFICRQQIMNHKGGYLIMHNLHFKILKVQLLHQFINYVFWVISL